jgi:hypothetical protein
MVAELRDTSAEVVEYFKCGCGHEWKRETYDGLVAVGCPACEAEQLTRLGRMFLAIVTAARE